MRERNRLASAIDGVEKLEQEVADTSELIEMAEAEGPIKFVINTEHHVDHIFGNWWYRGAGEVGDDHADGGKIESSLQTPPLKCAAWNLTKGL